MPIETQMILDAIRDVEKRIEVSQTSVIARISVLETKITRSEILENKLEMLKDDVIDLELALKLVSQSKSMWDSIVVRVVLIVANISGAVLTGLILWKLGLPS